MIPVVIHNLPQFISRKAKILEDAGIEQGKAEVETVLCHLLGVGRLDLYLHGAPSLNEPVVARLDEIIERRSTRYPLQYILEEAWFYGRRFFISPAVMIPTPETEVLCETAIKFVRGKAYAEPRIADLGVGSGVISVTVAAELLNCSVLALDISAQALDVARRNAEALGVIDKIEFIQSDYFVNVPDGRQFDLIVANPPYVADCDYEKLPPEVMADPSVALAAGEQGLDAIKAIVEDAPDYLAKNGRIMLEIGYNQADRVAELTASSDRYKSVSVVRDLNALDRVVILACDE